MSKLFARRTPPGVRGLKLMSSFIYFYLSCRTPPGVRGLKQNCLSRKSHFYVAPRPGCVD